MAENISHYIIVLIVFCIFSYYTILIMQVVALKKRGISLRCFFLEQCYIVIWTILTLPSCVMSLFFNNNVKLLQELHFWFFLPGLEIICFFIASVVINGLRLRSGKE